MADVIFSGLKLAYNAFKAYGDVKQELAAFEDDFDELNIRLMALAPVINSLEGRLTDDLIMVLNIAKIEQEKANVYTEELFQFCRAFKSEGSQFRMIAGAIANKAIDSLPGPLKRCANALMPVVAKHGVPEKAYSKFAEKLHFLMSSLSAAAGAQVLKGTEASGQQGSTRTGHTESKAVEKPMTAAESVAKLNDIVNEIVQEDDESFKAILIAVHNISCMSAAYIFGVWVEKIPYLLVVLLTSFPAKMLIQRAPSTKYLIELSRTPPRRSCCCPQNTINRLRRDCGREARAALNIGFFDYIRNYSRSVTNKWLLIPYFPLCACCCPCFFHRLQMRDFSVNGKRYALKVERKTEIWVDNQMLFDAKSLGYSGNPMVDSFRGT